MAKTENQSKRNRVVYLYVTEKMVQDYGLDRSRLEKYNSSKHWKYPISVTEEEYMAYNREHWRLKRKDDRDKKQFVIYFIERESDEFQDELQQVVDVENLVMRHLRIEALYATIRLMEPLNQKIILLYMDGHSEAEIARVVCHRRPSTNGNSESMSLSAKIYRQSKNFFKFWFLKRPNLSLIL